jgi:hypothetical protein
MDVLVIKCGKQTMEELRELRDFAILPSPFQESSYYRTRPSSY